jgi:hypothetical protein
MATGIWCVIAGGIALEFCDDVFKARKPLFEGIHITFGGAPFLHSTKKSTRHL